MRGGASPFSPHNFLRENNYYSSCRWRHHHHREASRMISQASCKIAESEAEITQPHTNILRPDCHRRRQTAATNHSKLWSSVQCVSDMCVILRGLPLMTSAKISHFLTPLSANSCNLPFYGCLLCLLLKVPPSLLSADVISGSPLSSLTIRYSADCKKGVELSDNHCIRFKKRHCAGAITYSKEDSAREECWWIVVVFRWEWICC